MNHSKAKKKLLYIVLLLIFIYSSYISTVIKPYQKSILGDIGGNLFFIPFLYISLFLLRKVPVKSFFIDNTFLLIFFVSIEVSQYFIPLGVFDILDIIGLSIGYITSLIILSFYKEYDKN